MYDISFILPVSANIGKHIRTGEIIDYGKRVNFFKRYGLLNIKDIKVKIFLLIGNENIENIENGWNCDIEVIKSDYFYAGHKIHKFYASLMEERIKESRWFMHLDDDSITNVYDLIEKIDNDYDYMKRYNISGVNPWHNVYKLPQFNKFLKLINKTSYKNILNNKNIKKYSCYGGEHTIFSQGALIYFVSNSNNKKILEESLLAKEQFYGDILVTVCANLCGIPFYEVDYLTVFEDFNKFVIKKVFHIHFIFRRKEYKNYVKLAKKIIERNLRNE